MTNQLSASTCKQFDMSTYEKSSMSTYNQFVIGMSTKEQSGMFAYNHQVCRHERSSMSPDDPPGYVGILTNIYMPNINNQ